MDMGIVSYVNLHSQLDLKKIFRLMPNSFVYICLSYPINWVVYNNNIVIKH